MLLSDVTDALWAAGFDDDEIEAFKDRLYKEDRSLEREAYEHAMSTIPHDPEIPDEWGRKIIKDNGAGMFENPPEGLITTESDRVILLDQVMKLLPTPKEDDASKATYKKKVEGIEARIMRAKNMGFSIVHGNTKIGKIDNFSLPAGQNFRGAACPGATELCESLCYAKDALFSMNEWRYFANWAYVLLWPGRFADTWKETKLTKVVRIHVGGDFFSPEYTDLWADIIESRPDTRFYAYTRSWQNGRGSIREEFLPQLRRLAKMQNMRLLLSVDRETGIPDKELVPEALRAWLALDNEDLPKEQLELIFRDHEGMGGKVISVMAGTTVCPVERTEKYIKKSKAITCQNCGWCWSTGHMAYDLRDDDPSQFDRFAKKDVEARAGQMFHQFWPFEKEAANPREGDCVCGYREPCDGCRECVICACSCPV
jgi:hypothetical protein